LAKCSAIKANGERCKIDAIDYAEWCWSHHPDYQDERRRRASRGGRRGGRGRPVAELTKLQERFEGLATRVLDGELDKGKAVVAGQLLQGARACIRDRLKATEQLELIERLEVLEQQLEEKKRSRPWAG
jgi:hypothetical protein